ncbi:ATP-binding protein [Streptomyces sp. NPDC007083]|uniref:ATP-binding protein n=1 Tax=Streptomyces sp. NPDC007083 TaxID=3156913 RepID=UPI0033F19B2E
MAPTLTPESTTALTLRDVNDWRGAPSPTVARTLQRGAHSATFAVPGIKRSVAVVRHLTRLWLDAQDIPDDSARYAVQLAVSELTTNAVEHTTSLVIIARLRKDRTSVLVEVQDQGGTPSVPRLKPPDTDLDHGRGLSLMAAVARGWGFRLDPTDNSCSVWAVVPHSNTQRKGTQAA